MPTGEVIVSLNVQMTPGEVQESWHDILGRNVRFLVVRDATYEEWVACLKEDGQWTAEKDAVARAYGHYYAIVAD